MPHSSAARLALLGVVVATILGVFAAAGSGSSSFVPPASAPRLVAHDTSRSFAGQVPHARSSQAATKRAQTIRRVFSATTARSFVGATSSGDTANASGDIGRTQFLQAVNGEYSVYSRTGSLLASVTSTAFWSGLSGPDGAGLCGTRPDGQPSVVYDRLADRFVVAEAAYSQSGTSRSGAFDECIAVSSTGNATGAWHRYVFQISTSLYPDLPSLGAWSDGYYLSFNQVTSGGSFAGVGAIAFERTAMLGGSDATARYFDLQNTIGVGGMVVASNGGLNAPTAGSPALYLQGHDDLIGNNDHLEVWAFHADFSGTGSTFQPVAQVPVAQFDSGFSCSKPGTSTTWSTCVPQDNTPNTPDLDPLARASVGSQEALPQLGGQVMYGRNGSGQTLTVAQTVASGSSSGIAWYRLQNNGAGWSVSAQGTYAPDSQWRFVPAAAFDNAGDVALGYDISSATKDPSLAYTDASDGTVGDRTVASGVAAHSGNTWGRSTSLRLDPIDLCTFWETGSATSGSGSAYTQIAAFSFSGCSPSASEPVLTGDPGWSSGLVREGQTITGSIASFTNASSTAYQWQRCDSSGLNCVDIAGENGLVHTISAADAAGDRTLRFAETATNGVGTSTAVSTATAVVQSIPPVNTALPVITGTAATGQILSVSNGSWTTSSPLGFTYRWRRCSGSSCTDIPGATSSIYTPTSDDVGSTVDVVVSATNTGGGTDAVAAATGAVVVGSTTATTPTTPTTTTTTTTTTDGKTDPADLKLTVSASPAKPEIGQNVTLFYTVTDKNAKPATKLQVTLTLPSGLSYAGAYAERGPGCTPSGTKVVCSLDYVSALTPVTRVQVYLTVKDAGSQTVAATATSEFPDLSAVDNTVSIAVGSGSSAVTTVGPSAPTPITNSKGVPVGLNGSEKSTAAVDTVPPSARALSSAGRRGKTAALKFRVYDDSGVARAAGTVVRSGRVVATFHTGFGPVAAGSVYYFGWHVPAKSAKGKYTFCVVASDRSKHSSKKSCAPLSVR